MSSGLLQRLAQQTLGLSQPLRSQIVVTGRSARRQPIPTEDGVAASSVPGPDASAAPFDATPTQTVAAPLLSPRSPAPTTSPLHPTDLTKAQWPLPARPVAQRPLASTPDRVLAAAPATAVQAAKPPAKPSPLTSQVSRSAETSQHTADIPHPVTRGPAAAHWGEPTALLPQQPLPRFTGPVQAPTQRQRFEGYAGHTAASPPTEVHVSIGRVDLTAASPTSSAARTATASKHEGSRSLADYLRPGAKGHA